MPDSTKDSKPQDSNNIESKLDSKQITESKTQDSKNIESTSKDSKNTESNNKDSNPISAKQSIKETSVHALNSRHIGKLQLTFPIIPSIICLAIGFFFWFSTPPGDAVVLINGEEKLIKGISQDGWRLLGIFIATILAIILKIMPIGALSIVAISIVAVTCVTAPTMKASMTNSLSGFHESLIWLIAVSVIISRGIIKTGLGRRVGFFFISLFGRRTLGIAYSLVISELILAPVTPSNTARGGGIIHPIMRSISQSFGSDPEHNTQNRIGRYLALVNFEANPITSGMFITATAPNPLVVNLVADVTGGNFHITWGQWAIAMLLPSLVALFLMPLVVWFFYPPEIKDTHNAKQLAKAELGKMGKMTHLEKVMLGIFGIMLLLWAGVTDLIGIKMDPTAVAFIGLSLSLLAGILTWQDCLSEKSAWDTLVWFSALVMMATFLNKLGVITYVAQHLEVSIRGLGLSWFWACLILTLIYLYLHYFFASTTAHVAAMFAAFYGTGIALGAPPMLYALMLAAAGNIMMSLTHYATGTAPVIFGSGYITIGEWWKMGFIMSIVNLIIFAIFGAIWWKVLGYY